MACPSSEKNERSVSSLLPDLCPFRTACELCSCVGLLMERELFSPDRAQPSLTIAEVVGFKGEHHAPSYRSVAPFGYPTITYVQLSH